MPKATVTNIDELPEVLTLEQVQHVLGISRPKSYQLAHSQSFPAIRIGRAIRVTRSALLDWLDKQSGDLE